MYDSHFGDSYGASAPECYERFFVPAIGAPLAADLVRRAALRPGERVLDVACGTGVVARLAARGVGDAGTVAGLDLNPGMLAVAESAAPADASIEWHEASVEEMPLKDESFDVVLCQMGLQFVEDRPAALGEMRRVLALGGRLLLNAPGPANPLFEVFDDALREHIGPQAAGFVRQVFALDDTGELRDLMTDAGFRDVEVEAEEVELHLPAAEDFLWQYVRSTPLAGILAEAGEAARDALARDVVGKWREFERAGGMAGPQRMLVASARR
ncbi:MAG: methyltransferase domain-containing protein [Gemmatimonadota bacterium]